MKGSSPKQVFELGIGITSPFYFFFIFFLMALITFWKRAIHTYVCTDLSGMLSECMTPTTNHPIWQGAA